MQSSVQMRRTYRYAVAICAVAALTQGAAVALPVAAHRPQHAPELAARSSVEKGIVQTVGRNGIRLRALDGSEQWIVLAARVSVRVNDLPSPLSDVRRGFVAEVSFGPRGKGLSVSAYGTVPLTVERGMVELATATSLSIRTQQARLILVNIGPTTQVSVNGAPASLTQIVPGTRVAVGHRGAAPAERIRAVVPPTPPAAPTVTDRGRVTAIDDAGLTIRRGRDGAVILIAIDGATQVEGGTLGGVTPGTRVAIRHAEGGPAKLITILQGTGSP